MPGVLVVDDNSSIRTLLRTFVETQTGLQVCGEAVDGIDALEKARKLMPDVVVLDLAMPRLNGIEAACIIKREMPAVRVVLFTFHVEPLGKTLASVIGIDFVIGKGEPLSKLAEHLRSFAKPKAEAPAPSIATN